ncbi:DUF3040 domain-containing protein [Actinoallomurus acaciae]|uniref:DUF3040 domain-containing protein n=1 Tax=Actinoallomurus acaciae TaxID=502577 RepID=A0ABV5YV15_9ACTN
MALSMEEERILTEIASQLGQEDPALAGRLANFGRLRRRRRIRAIAAIVIAVLVIGTLVGAAFMTLPA